MIIDELSMNSLVLISSSTETCRALNLLECIQKDEYEHMRVVVVVAIANFVSTLNLKLTSLCICNAY